MVSCAEAAVVRSDALLVLGGRSAEMAQHRILCGLMSRWTIFCAWRCASPSATYSSMEDRCSMVRKGTTRTVYRISMAHLSQTALESLGDRHHLCCCFGGGCNARLGHIVSMKI